MVNSCIVTGCKREAYPGCGISFHRIPAPRERRTSWIAAMKLDNNVSKSACICSMHFKDDDYITMAKTKLKPQAVPSILSEAFSYNNKNEVFNFKKVKIVSVQSASDSDLAQVETLDLQNEDSGNYEYVGISGIPPIIKIEAVEPSTQSQDIDESSNIEALKHNVKILKQRLKRRDIKIQKLRSILKVLKRKCDNYAAIIEYSQPPCEES